MSKWSALLVGMGLWSVGAVVMQTGAAIPPAMLSLTEIQKGEIDQQRQVFVELAKKMIPSVVNIAVVSQISERDESEFSDEAFDDFFREYFGSSRPKKSKPPGPLKSVAVGTGFVIDQQGTILTNQHVVEGAVEIKVGFSQPSGSTQKHAQYKARVIARDPDFDIALLRIDSGSHALQRFTPVVFGDSDQTQIGEYVMAIGNPFGQGHTVTHGIISQKDRATPDMPLATYLQTDAPINLGNSGGPLVNLRGEVIGINNAIQVNADGIGFAIPINLIKSSLPELRLKGRVARGHMGITVEDLPPGLGERLGGANLRAPFVSRVEENQPGHRAGIRVFDLLLSVNGRSVESSSEVASMIAAMKPGMMVVVEVLRGGHKRKIMVKLSSTSRAQVNEGLFLDKKKPEPWEKRVGVTVSNLDETKKRDLGLMPSAQGVLVIDVEPGSPADAAGIQTNDIVIEANGQKVQNAKAFLSSLRRSADREVLLRIRRPNPKGDDFFVAAIVDGKSS